MRGRAVGVPGGGEGARPRGPGYSPGSAVLRAAPSSMVATSRMWLSRPVLPGSRRPGEFNASVALTTLQVLRTPRWLAAAVGRADISRPHHCVIILQGAPLAGGSQVWSLAQPYQQHREPVRDTESWVMLLTTYRIKGWVGPPHRRFGSR